MSRPLIPVFSLGFFSFLFVLSSSNTSILFYFIISYYYLVESCFLMRDRKVEKEWSGWNKMTGGGQGWTSGSRLFTPEICFHEDSDH